MRNQSEQRRGHARCNPGRVTMAEIRRRHRGNFFDRASKRGGRGGDSFYGPFTGMGGVIFLTFSPYFGPSIWRFYDDGRITDVSPPDGHRLSLKLALALARSWAKGTHPSTADVLRSMGTPGATKLAATWLGEAKQRVLDDMRSRRLPITINPQDWLDIHGADAYAMPAPAEVERALHATPALSRDATINRAYLESAVRHDIAGWIGSMGHTKALKRLGKSAFRENPRRRRRTP